MNKAFNIIATICWGLIVFISLPINILCLVVLGRVRDIGDTTKLFLKSLTVSDILTSLLRGIPAIAAAVRNEWPFGDLVCLLITIPHDATTFAGLLSLLAVNVDRCIAVLSPLRYPVLVDIKKARISMVLLWSVSFLSILPLAIACNWTASYVMYEHSCRFDFNRNQTTYGYTFYSITWIYIPAVCVFLIVSCFVLVIGTSVHLRYKVSKRSNRHIHNRMQSVSTRAATTFFLMTLSQVLVNVPWIVNIFINEHMFLKTFAVIMYFSGGIWNVVIYYFRNRTFKNEMNRFIYRFCNRFRGLLLLSGQPIDNISFKAHAQCRVWF